MTSSVFSEEACSSACSIGFTDYTHDLYKSHFLAIHCSRLTSNQLVSALKVSLGGRNSSELATEYEEFFLSSADDIADLLKKLPKSTPHSCTHFQAQQMVCSMIQVGGWEGPGGNRGVLLSFLLHFEYL